MPRKKAENKEQTTLVPETEVLAPEDGAENDLPENPFIEKKASPDAIDESPDKSDLIETDAGELDKSKEFTISGDFSGPLDIERRLEEELAALDAEISASGGTEQDAVQAPPPEQDNKPESEISAPVRASGKKRVSQSTALDAPRSPANFYQGDFRHLDRDLTDLERQEWNDIYASFRSQSILTGVVAGVDQNRLPIRNADGKVEMRLITSLVVIGHRVKVMIPENAVFVKGEERRAFLTRGMIGATVDYVIVSIDREGEVALASRAIAMVKRRRAFSSGRNIAKSGDIVDCSVTVTGPSRCLLTCGGYDVPMRPSDMSYTSILDMRDVYRPGQILKARVITHEPAQRNLRLSVKEATSNPFDGAERRHPVGSRRQAVISGKYKGGVFCTMPDGTVCLCLYSNAHYDSEFMLGDNVIIYISQYNYRMRHIYGRIVSKW